jgi:MFS family permease
LVAPNFRERLTVAVGRLRQVVTTLAAAARNPDIRRAELAWGASVAAEWAHFVALGVFAYGRGGTSAVGIAGLVRLLPAAAIAPFASSLGDRFRRERFLLGVVLVGSAALAVSAAGAFAGNRPVVFAAAAVVGACSTLFRPALQALLPSLAGTPRDLIAANGATSTLESLGTLAGPLAAGVLVAIVSVGAVFAAGAGVLLGSAVLLARVSVEGRAARAAGGGAAWDGFEAIASVRRARLLVGLIVSQTFVRGCLNVLIVVAAFRVLHKGASEVGYLTAAIGAGGLVGALGAVSLHSRRLAPPFGWSLVFWGAPIMLIAPLPFLAAALLLLAVVGAANSVEDVAGFTLLQRVTPDDVLTRVLGVTWGLAMGAVAVGSIAAPALVKVTGPRLAFLGVGAILPLLSLASYRRLREIDAAVAPAPQLALVEGVSIFAPLSLATKERIASRLVAVELERGEVVIRAGDVGDHFYVVVDGMLTIEAGDVVSEARPGDFFGEIALLRDVPRTATVRAASDARLYSLLREDFLAAVTGHSGARSEAHAVASARLAGK